MPVKFIKVKEREAEKLAKKFVKKLKGSGVFAPSYYRALVDLKKSDLLRQGKPILLDHKGKEI